MAEFNEKLHPRAPKGTENGGEFIDNSYSEAAKHEQIKIAQKLRQKLIDIGIYVYEPNTSITEYGVSTYLTYRDLNGEEYKFRISDHSVENYDRLMNEFHYDKDTNLDALVKKFQSRVIGNAYYKNERDNMFKRAKIKEKYLMDNREKLVNGKLKGLNFGKYERTKMDLNEFRAKHPNATNILQIKDGNAFYYEYAIPKDKNEAQNKPTLKYVENINNLIDKYNP